MRCVAAILLLASALRAQTPVEAPKGSIAGTVRDSLGVPLSGVVVQADLRTEIVNLRVKDNVFRVATGVINGVTDARGKYNLPDLSAGLYSVSSERDVELEGPRPVSLESGQNVTVDFVIPVPPAVAGRVWTPTATRWPARPYTS